MLARGLADQSPTSFSMLKRHTRKSLLTTDTSHFAVLFISFMPGQVAPAFGSPLAASVPSLPPDSSASTSVSDLQHF